MKLLLILTQIRLQALLQIDLDENIPSKIKYFSVIAVQNLDNRGNLNLFHSNVNGLESKFENLNQFLGSSLTNFDIIAISVTSEKEDISFISNVDLEGYVLFSTPTSSNKGGTAVYVNKLYKPFESFDLKMPSAVCESVFVEISNSRSKTIVCGSKYGHPNYDLRGFLLIWNSY